MTEPTPLREPPRKPLLIYDGECGFCSFWIRRWQRLTRDRIDYLPLQNAAIARRFPELARTALETAVHLIDPDGRVCTGAEAVFRSLASHPAWRWPLALYQKVPGARLASEWTYGVVARNRTTFSVLTRLLWGFQTEPSEYAGVRRWFLSGLGLIYVAAFASLWFQVEGLIGSRGVLPVQEILSGAQGYFTQQTSPWLGYYQFPTWCWLSGSDGFLKGLCGAGMVLGLGLTLGIAPALCTFVLWTLYLSLVTVGRDFLAFQWDALLLETGLLAVLFAPTSWWPRRTVDQGVPRFPLFLLRWLLFRLMFESGCVKLLSGDPTWRNLTALTFHYQTQPLPTWLAATAHHWPGGIQQTCVAGLFSIELALPFLIFAPRRLRLIACGGFAILQLWILLTGNYGIFNYLTLLLCLVLLDDAALSRLIPRRWQRSTSSTDSCGNLESINSPALAPSAKSLGRSASWIRATAATIILLVTLEQLMGMLNPTGQRWLRPVEAIGDALAPLRSLNRYGLFAVMTTSRPEIIVEGSNDGKTWRAYEFKFKPGAPNHRPAFVAPHQPRLDWQMWFAALGTAQENPWFTRFCVRLLEGSPEVLGLLESNPFPSTPPRYVRAVLYDYQFASPLLNREGAWWERRLLGDYLPPISLQKQ